ncbi:hypothetical protein BATDEDRAFT_86096 [Batrachochytrium dendrobatidis JAM81]|uniref:RING-type E3 ubiquitin transferase n=2 Tax=Batrachochytrium dendrobatidis TaxID=109871 RepID=F4NX43_BATDJ|nr:uncharacterized protein BATDEDRAFT_86096 [Batrachochytrium dendrobatidis JAM81]EGF82293.1 hypothetical protein BATDEDRAFT_86096 [Batrachochytrium dendrobatidis JAM81]|eukprot:XP_006676870.1 hypothetical protein BATDEDRAFT_86096 [Batrachochytrium dendrobatidis JAM81]
MDVLDHTEPSHIVSDIPSQTKQTCHVTSTETTLLESANDNMEDVGQSSQAAALPSTTSYSFTATSLRQRHVPLRESILPDTRNHGVGMNSNAYPSQSTSPVRPSNSTEPLSETKPDQNDQDADQGGLFECNICLDMASDPVVTLCGHLFCWSCLHQWLSSRLSASNTCPVCKAGVDRDKVIPIYVRGREPKDPRVSKEVPNRPPGQRTEPVSNNPWDFGGFFGPGRVNFGNTQLGFGMMPFGIQFSFGQGINNHNFHAGPQGVNQGGALDHSQRLQAFVSRLFLMIATLVLISIILY